MNRCHALPFALRSLIWSLPPAVLTLLFALCSLPLAAHAQSATATLSGTVEDANGAVIPGVTITLLNNATSLKRETTTNDQGYFTFPLLPPGTYTLTSQHEGFTTAKVGDLTLNVGDQKALKIQLKTGDVKETVNVTAESPLINESPAVGTVVDRQFVANIPLNGRSFQSLITLTPGIVLTPAGTLGVQGQFSVNGQRADANNFMVDGVGANFGSAPNSGAGAQTSGSLPALTTFGTTQSLASVDAMQEFRVQTSTYAAEYGRQPGAQVSIITRSGTNDFHGSVFDYVRNDVFDANDWFANRAGQRRPPERQNDFGGTLSGPLLVPRFGEGGHQPWYNGRNRTFFFFSYEGLRLRLPKVKSTNVPTLALRQSAPAALQPILAAFPTPNGRDLGNGLAELAASYSDRAKLNATSVRVDHKINEKWSMLGRYNSAPSQTVSRVDDQLSRVATEDIKTRTITLGLIATFTSRTINDFRVNYSEAPTSRVSELDSFGGAVVPSSNALLPNQYAGGTSQSNVTLPFAGRTSTGSPGIGFANHFTTTQRQFNLVESFSYMTGAHAFKFGIDFRRLAPTFLLNTYALNVMFSSQQQIINGVAGTGIIVAKPKTKPRYVNVSAYAQDTWRFSRRATIDLGLRWDVNPPPGEATANHPLAVTSISNLATMDLAPNGTALWKTSYNNFAPRIGAAYELIQRPGWETVIRGGFGVFYDTGNNQSASGLNSYPYQVVRIASNIAFPLSAVQVAPPALPNPSSLTPPYSGLVVLFDPALKLPYTLQWSFAVQQSLGKSQALSLTYVGAVGRRLLQQRRLNLSTINPKFTTVDLTTNKATSDYNALQAQFQRRLSNGLQALVSYSWSHALDEDSTDFGSIIPVRGNAAFDRRHVLAAAVTYDIPAPTGERFVKAILEHWSIDTSVHAQSAAPVDIVANQVVNPADGTLIGNRPNLVGGVPLYIYDPSLPGGRKINRNAFSVPATGQFGNLGRNVLRGLSAWQIDLALRRELKLTEDVNLELRAEAFNVFNHPNFGAIQTTLGSNASPTPNFGQATSMLNTQLGGLSALYQIGGPRSMQLALKLRF